MRDKEHQYYFFVQRYQFWYAEVPVAKVLQRGQTDTKRQSAILASCICVKLDWPWGEQERGAGFQQMASKLTHHNFF